MRRVGGKWNWDLQSKTAARRGSNQRQTNAPLSKWPPVNNSASLWNLKMKNYKSNLQDASPSPNTMTQWPNRPTLCLVEQRSILSILSHFEPFLSEALIGMRKSEGKGTSEAGYSLSPLFLPKWHLTHKSFMLLIVQRCPWPAIPQPPLFTKFLRPGRIDYRGHVMHIEGVCVPELIITTLAAWTCLSSHRQLPFA